MNKVERIRTKLGITQEKLAKELGMSQGSISRLEKEQKISRKLSLALDGLEVKYQKGNSNGKGRT